MRCCSCHSQSICASSDASLRAVLELQEGSNTEEEDGEEEDGRASSPSAANDREALTPLPMPVPVAALAATHNFTCPDWNAQANDQLASDGGEAFDIKDFRNLKHWKEFVEPEETPVALTDKKGGPNKSGYIGISEAATKTDWIARVSTKPYAEGSGNIHPLRVIPKSCKAEEVRALPLALQLPISSTIIVNDSTANTASPMQWH